MIFPFSDIGKRYHSFDYAMRRRFGGKVAKLPLDMGFTCPNRDGSRGYGGCRFCSDRGGGEFCASGSVREQLLAQAEVIRGKWQPVGYIPYFQAYTNTYAPLFRLQPLWEEALSFPGTVGISIATRPDCLPDDILAALEALNRRTFLTVELGLQTVHDETAARMNRRHSYADFLRGYEALRERDIPVCVHLINGLPGETREMMLESAETVARLRPSFLMLHLLQVLRGTPLAEDYAAGLVPTMERDDYVSLLCDQIERLPPETVLERLTGDGKAEELLAPAYSRRKRELLNAIDRELRIRESVQGCRFG